MKVKYCIKKTLIFVSVFYLVFSCKSDKEILEITNPDEQLVTKITISGDNINDGTTSQLTATILPSNATDKSVTWSSSNENIGHIDQKGILTAVSNGTVSVKAQANDGSGVIGQKSVLVSGVTTVPTEINILNAQDINDGQPLQLSFEIIPENTTNKTINWSVSDNSVASITSEGLLTPLKDGNVDVTIASVPYPEINNTVSISISGKNNQSQDELRAFPSAEGFGQDATGGRGGRVLFVTNLNDSGSGSLREAINTSGARYILFKISGTIQLQSSLPIRNGDVTIAGQTAPGDGICVAGYPVTIDADNVIIRFMRFRLGDSNNIEADALGGRFHKNIIIDHCSVSWSVDECLSFYGNQNTTVQWTFITESLRSSVHSKGNHGYGGIWGGKNASFHHNLLAHHDSRNPRLGEPLGDGFALTDLVDLRNNVIYNWGGNSGYGGEAMNVNIVNSYYKPGPASSKKDRIFAIDKKTGTSYPVNDIWGKFYVDGNIVEGYTNATNDNWNYGVANQFNSKYGTISQAELDAMRMAQPHPINNNVYTHDAQEAYEKVLSFGGCSLKRDQIDTRIENEVRNTSYTYSGSKGSSRGLIDSQNDVGGWPVLNSTTAPQDSSNDGMPDSWKISKGLSTSEYNPNGKELSNVYDNIEVYINGLVSHIIEQQK